MTNHRTRLAALLALAITLCAGVATGADTFTGRVLAVSDGDTITVMRSGSPVKIRFNGIDAPEKAQPFGDRAYQFVSRKANGETVTIRPTDTDRYGRVVGVVILPDGKNLNAELVAAGMAWHYKRYSDDATLARLEREARKARRGLWADADPIPPWKWRRGERGGGDRDAETSEAGAGAFHGNVRSRKFHRPGCRHYRCPNCTAVFHSRREAIAAGFQPCGICKP